MRRWLGGRPLEDDASRLLTWSREAAGGLTHNILSATHTDTISGAVAQNAMIIGNATPAWSLLTGPAAQYERLESGGSPFVPAWTVNLGMADDAYIGIPAGGRLIFDSTPATDEIRVVDGALSLYGNSLLLDVDGDTSINCSTDDVIKVVVHSGVDFQFSIDLFSVLSSSGISMADDTWIGLGQSVGRIAFDSTPNPDQIQIWSADLHIATASRGIIHADGVTAGYLLQADGTRYVPANPATSLPIAPVAQGDIIIANGTPAWSVLTLGAAAGYALVSTATTVAWDQTPSWSGLHTFTATPAIEIDVATGDPVIVFDTQGADKFTIGVDDSDSDAFKISGGGSLGTSDYIVCVSSEVQLKEDTDIDGVLTLQQQGEPSDPSEGAGVLWLSNGTGAGDVGDLMWKSTESAVTKTETLIDFSGI